MADTRQYQCPWCDQNSDATTLRCPSCGSPIDLRAAVSQGRWSELPKIKDMTMIQFNQSFCQIAGKYVPVADFNLAPGEKIYFGRQLLLWKDEQVKVNATINLMRIFETLLAGMPLLRTEATGPGRLAFSKDMPGKLIPLPLQKGKTIDVRKHLFMIATHSVEFDWFSTNIWFDTQNGKDIDRHFPIGKYMDRFTATDEPGLLLLHGSGHVFFRELDEGQSILIKPTSLLFKETTVQMHLHFEHPVGFEPNLFITQFRHIWLRLVGPGRIAVQSHFEPMEGEQGYIINRSPMTTVKQW